MSTIDASIIPRVPREWQIPFMTQEPTTGDFYMNPVGLLWTGLIIAIVTAVALMIVRVVKGR
jgi:hypothetical protein